VRKKYGELWSTNKKVIGVNVNPLKWTFHETKFWPLGVLAPQIFARAKDRRRLASTYQKPGQGPPNILRANI